MPVGWYVKRLGAMSSREVLHRVAEQGRRSISRRRTFGWQAFDQHRGVRPIPGLVQTLKAGMTPPLEAALRASVDALLDGRFSAHGVAWPKRDARDLFPPELWRLDPITGRLWSGQDTYCFDVRYRDERELGDVKYVWDLNRLQFLQPLAAAVALWADRRALAAVEGAIASWVRANPPYRGLCWGSGIELALRAVTLAFVVTLCGEALDPQVRGQVASVLAAHQYWLRRYPSLYSSANNHLVSEALGEFVIACLMPDGVHSREIEAHAREVLEREIALQILPDGTPAEQSPSYGGFTVEMVLVADLLARAFGRPLAPIVAERTGAYAAFVGTLSGGSGRVPNIGDDDEGRVITLCAAREMAYPVSIARAVAGHQGVAPPVARSRDEAELRDAFFAVAAPERVPDDGVHCFRAGGCTVVRQTRAGRRMHVTVDHGPLGYLSIAAHGHADANAVTLSLDDEEIFVDPGTFLYHSGGAWRDWFRGTGAHNTLRLSGVDQSLIAGAFNWSHKARASLESLDDAADWSLAVRHDGYRKRFGVEHHRRVSATRAGLVIEDRLVGEPCRVPAEVIFQLAPGLEAAGSNTTRVIGRAGEPLLSIDFSEEGTITATSGGDAPGLGGWVSETFGSKVPAVRLCWQGVLPESGLRTTLDWSR